MHIHSVSIPAGDVALPGYFFLSEVVDKLVIFVHGSGSSRNSPRNRMVAETFVGKGINSLLFDLLTEEEDTSFSKRFDIALLTERLIHVTRWAQSQTISEKAHIGYFGASTGVAAALCASLVCSNVKTVVSRGGRPDLATKNLSLIHLPVLLIVGEKDKEVIALNRKAFASLQGEKELSIIPGASHLFEEEGTLQSVAALAANWFLRYLSPSLPVQHKRTEDV